MTDSKNPQERDLRPGTIVRFDSTGEPEYGVVVHCWLEDEIAGYDCYVAFFGKQLPVGRPEKRPYLLRYAATQLTVEKLPDGL